MPIRRGACALLALVLTGGAGLAASPAPVQQAPGQPPAGGAAPDAAASAQEAADATGLAAVEIIDHGVAEFLPATIKPAFTQLDGCYRTLTPKTTKRVCKAISAMFAKLKPRIEQDIDTLGDDARNGRFGPDDENDKTYGDDPRKDVMDCYHLAIGLMYDKPDGVAVLLPVLKLPHVKAWPEVQVLVLEGLGFREDPALLKDFEAYLDNPDPTIASAAAEALGRLREQSMEVKRRAVGAIIDAYMAAQKASDKEKEKIGVEEEDDVFPARNHLSSLHVAFRGALSSLTRQTIDKPADWRAWFDEHGKDAAW